MSLLQRAGGLFGYVLGCPFAWGLSKGFSIAIFVVVILFSLLLITHTRVTQISGQGAQGSGRQNCWKRLKTVMTLTDGAPSQFPNEVRVGDTTLAFAEGVPSHDGDDDGNETTIGRRCTYRL